MLSLPDIDEETETLFSHLRGLANGEIGEDTTLVEDFRLGINYHSPSLYSFVDNDSLYNPVIKNLVSLLLRVIPTAPPEYSRLLERLLAPLKFDEICIYISPQAIVESARNPATQKFTLKILEDKIHDDSSAVRFVGDTDLVYTLVSDVVEAEHDCIALANSIFHIITGVLNTDYGLLSAEKLEFLTNFSQDQILTTAHFCNYVSILSAIVCIDFSQQPWGPKLFPFEFHRVLEFDQSQTKGVWFPLLAKAYKEWIGTVPFSWLKPFISDLFEHVVRNCPDRLALTYTDDYVMAYQDILANLSACRGEALEFAQQFLLRPDVDIVDQNVSSSHHFFSQICLKNLPEKDAFFTSHFVDLDVKSGSQFVSQCLFALIEDEYFFGLVAQKKMLTSDNLRNWPIERLFKFLDVMASYNHSAQYMISELPYLVSTYLITIDRTMSSKAIWDDKRAALHKLLKIRKIDLGMWKAGLSDCLYEMENGRRLANIEPQVEVMDAAMMG